VAPRFAFCFAAFAMAGGAAQMHRQEASLQAGGSRRGLRNVPSSIYESWKRTPMANAQRAPPLSGIYPGDFTLRSSGCAYA